MAPINLVLSHQLLSSGSDPVDVSITPLPCFPQSICFCQAPLGLILLSPGVASTCRFSDLKGDKNRETKVNIGNMDQIMLSIWDVGET